MTLKEVEKEMSDQKILISNMKNNKMSSIVVTEFGQSFPFEKGDKIL
jgi:hypothetical protein